MAIGNQNQEEVPQNMRKQLDFVVRNIGWSYAIFWSISSRQPGVLEWGDGYYNGDIKTRKSVQAGELQVEQPGLQRSEQLRELYESLYAAETNPQAKRPSAALSPEDLTDTEWYYLVCMSFVFNIGQGLPGKSLAKNETIWLCNAHLAETEVFSRSLLAKSASIKTVVCFPHLGGVVELGVTELVLEDQNLIQQVKTSFMETPYPIVSWIPNHVSRKIPNTNDHVRVELDHNNMTETDFDQLVDCPEDYICSPDNSLHSFGATQLRDESNMVNGIDVEISHLQGRQFMDESRNCLNNSMNSSDCVPQIYENPENIVPLSDEKKTITNCVDDSQECNQQTLKSSDFQGDKTHYQTVLSTLLKSSHQLIVGPYFRRGYRESSFVGWKKDASSSGRRVPTGTPQRLLKKVLFEVARMHENCQLESARNAERKQKLLTSEADEIDRNRVLSERKRREKIKERYMILGSLVPSGGKVDKVSVLDHAIQYLRGLEKRVEELESCKGVADQESRAQNKLHDAIERTSDNYGSSKNPLVNKRKACEMDELKEGNPQLLLRNSSTDNITVSIVNKDVSIEMECPWRESVLIEVMEAISKLHMDSLTVQSSNTDGMLSLAIKAQLKGSKIASAGVIRQAILKIIRKS